MIKNSAATRSYENSLPRQVSKNPSHCGDNHISASALNQSKNTSVNMSTELAVKNEIDFAVIEQVVMQGDLSKLNPQQRVHYYHKFCESAGLNPFTRPFDYISLNGKLTLYAKKECTEQLRKLNGISIEGIEGKVVDDLYIVKARARDRIGRTDESTGAVTIGNLRGDAKANAIMKAETKAKRRVTLSISGLGLVDETELETIPSAKNIEIDLDTGNFKNRITQDQAEQLSDILSECSDDYKASFYRRLKKNCNASEVNEIHCDIYEKIKEDVLKNRDKHKETQQVLEAFLEHHEDKKEGKSFDRFNLDVKPLSEMMGDAAMVGV